jgi:hypothetical protein
MTMTLFERLSNNKGTLSSALGKALARDVLEGGQAQILTECLELVCYLAPDPAGKNIRAGAAKVVEIVAEKRPELVAPHLAALFPALKAPEPQTRWMVLRIMGFCAHLNPAVARKAIPYAEACLDYKEGLVLASSADLYLGDLAAVSKKDAAKAFPLLERSLETAIENEPDWLLEAIIKAYPNLGDAEQRQARAFAERHQYSARKTTQQRAKKLLRLG